VQLMRPGQKSDFAVAKLHEVMDGSANSRRVVEQDGAGLGIVQSEFGQDHGNVPMGQLVEHRLFFTEGQNRHALHLAFQHAAYAGGQDRRIAVGGTDQDLVAVGHGDFFEVLDELGEEGIGNVFNNDAKNAATWVLGK